MNNPYETNDRLDQQARTVADVLATEAGASVLLRAAAGQLLKAGGRDLAQTAWERALQREEEAGR